MHPQNGVKSGVNIPEVKHANSKVSGLSNPDSTIQFDIVMIDAYQFQLTILKIKKKISWI